MTSKSALLVMDMQNGIAKGLSNADEVIEANRKAIETARNNDIPVIFVRVAFSNDFAEVSPKNKSFSQIKKSGQAMGVNDEATQVVDELAPAENEVIVTKHRFSAFTGSNLEVLLRGKQVDHLILTGVATSGVVLSTAVEAADKDFELTILEDAVMDRELDKHEFLIDKILPRYADIVTIEEWNSSIK
nr:isochorismatase family cysteine hydrolase [Mammaliicoccus sp. Marseille-Q6498]